MEDTDFRPLVPFEDQSDSYVHGFEAGMIWQRMQQAEEVIETDIPLHRANLRTFEKMASAAGYDFERSLLKGEMKEWVEITFTRRPVVRNHLSVVT